MAHQSSGKPCAEAEPPAVQHEHGGEGDSTSAPDEHQVSPLTYGKVFGAIPRVTGVNTPNINDRIAKKWGLPEVTSSSEFRKIYTDGRAALRYSNTSLVQLWCRWFGRFKCLFKSLLLSQPQRQHNLNTAVGLDI